MPNKDDITQPIPVELEKKYADRPVSLGTELKAGFLGNEDELILEFLSHVPNPRGACLPQLIIYCVYRYGLMGQRRLMARLKHLIQRGEIRYSEAAGLTFYKKV